MRGAGRAFSSGMDRKALSGDGIGEAFYRHFIRGHNCLEDMDKLVVAVLHGYCIGGGLQLAVACDVRDAGACDRLISETVAALGGPDVLGFATAVGPLVGLRRAAGGGGGGGLAANGLRGSLGGPAPPSHYRAGIPEALESILIRGSRVEILRDCGHIPQAEKLETTLTLVRRFLESG